MKIIAGVIGLGRIGSQWDSGACVGMPRTHVGAIMCNEEFDLRAVCDEDTAARERFAKEWKLTVPIYQSATDMMESQKLDVICVATPPSTHHAIIAQTILRGTKLVFCEKPFCTNAAEAQETTVLAAQYGVTISVNYHRRWDARIAALKAQVDNMPPPRYVDIIYGKGLLNYGSHIVNLLMHFFGQVRIVQSQKLHADQLQMDDPSVSSVLTFESGFRAMLKGIDHVTYDLFDMDIYYPEMKIRLESGGYLIESYDAVQDSRIIGYRHLVRNQNKTTFELVHGLTGAYREIHGIISGELSGGVSTAEAAVQTLCVVDAIKASAEKGCPITV